MQGQGCSNSFRRNFYFDSDHRADHLNVVPNASSLHDGQHASTRWMGQSSSNLETRNHVSFRQFLGDDFWLSPLGNQPGTGQRFEERHFLENVISPGTNSHVISSNQHGLIGPSILPVQASSGPHLQYNFDLNAVHDRGDGIDANQDDGPLLSLDLFGAGAAPGDQVQASGGSSSPVMIYSGIAGYVLEENICREGLPADGRRRLLCKRRAPEIALGQATYADSSSSSTQQAAGNFVLPAVIAQDNAMIGSLSATSSSSNCLNSSNSSGFVSALPTSSNFQQISNGSGQINNFQRNTRMRRTVLDQQNPTSTNMLTWNSSINAPVQVQTTGQSAVFSAFARFQNTGSLPAPVSLTPAMQQPIVQVSNSLQARQPSNWNGTTMSLGGSLFISPDQPTINLREALGQAVNLRNHRRNLMIPLTNMQGNLNSVNGIANNFLGNIASSSRTQSSSGMHLPSSSIRSPQQITVDQYGQRLQHLVSQGNYCPIHSSPAVRDMDVSVRGGNARPAQVPIRLGSRSERQASHHSQVSPTVPSQVTAQRRNRLASEVRNALGLVRRGGGLRLEDVMVIDRSFLYGVPEMLAAAHDDMRLDVDNMSYEELLDLEEQIGNVCTGLSDEVILANLRRRKYQSITIQSPTEAEPCCICQEDYADGEELGKLDCGHDFHFNCIKQWLVQKNSCPICKKTALAI